MELSLVADECIDREIVEALRAAGHMVQYVAELAPSISDVEVLRLATEADALLLTADKDFGELVFRQRQLHSGVLLLRLAGQAQPYKAQTAVKVIQEYGDELLGAFSVLEAGRLRVRQPENES